MSTVCESAESMAPSGKTVRMLPTCRSLTITGAPSEVTRRLPRRHFVWNSDFPGLGPSDRMGNMAATPSAPRARPSSFAMNVRRSMGRTPRSNDSANAWRSTSDDDSGSRA